MSESMGTPPTVLETERLRLRPFSLEDAPFAMALVNDPDWLRYIGDRNVRTIQDAESYLRKGPVAMYERLGLGMLVVVLKSTGEPIGTCGLIRRDTLDDVDIGFAFLPAHRGRGYALEAAKAVLEHGRRDHGLGRIVAIVSRDNERSIRLLETLGLRFERTIRMPGDEVEVALYATPSSSSPRG